MEIIDDHHRFYANETGLCVYISSERSTITCSSPLFQQIKYLKLELPKIPSSLLNNLLDIGKKNMFFVFNLFCQNNLLFIQITEFIRIIFNIILLVNFHQISDDDAQETVTCLSNLVYLPNITDIEFGSSFNTYRWKHVQYILK
jgi:hypothetical protein